MTTRSTVFAYGTLTDPDRVDALLDDWSFDGAAVLPGLRRVEGRYPTLVPGGQARGQLLETTDLARLDVYEGVEDGPYVRVTVPGPDGRRIHLYVAPPAAVGAPGEWPGNGPFGDRVAAYLDAETVTIRRGDR